METTAGDNSGLTWTFLRIKIALKNKNLLENDKNGPKMLQII